MLPDLCGPGGRFRCELVIHIFDLPTTLFDSAAVINNKIGSLDLGFHGRLGHHAPCNFSTGSFWIEVVPGCPTVYPLLWLACDNDDLIKAAAQSGFEQQRGLEDHDGIGLA